MLSVELLARKLPDALNFLEEKGIVPEIEYAVPRVGADFDKTVGDAWRVVRVDDGGRKLVVTKYPSRADK